MSKRREDVKDEQPVVVPAGEIKSETKEEAIERLEHEARRRALARLTGEGETKPEVTPAKPTQKTTVGMPPLYF
jgi:hypothetical protein